MEETDLLRDTIIQGGILEEKEQVRVSTIILTLKRISEISLDEIEEFYRE